MVARMIPGERTCYELAADTGLAYLTVCQYARELHRKGAIHVCGYRKDSRDRDAAKIYKLGPGRDARRYKKSAATRKREERQRKAMLKERGPAPALALAWTPTAIAEARA